ncbi:MAG: tetratricopeptide repeat protein [Okeania sp. SIO3I5]|nr:tetratricopeptide repeat protein [Okeania sp. SIO3I5]
MLLSQEGEKVCSIVGLTGGGGIGKSALAYHFATIHQETYPDGVIGLRVDEKDVNTIARRLAKVIDAPIPEDDDLEAREIMQRFFAPKRMLLIFDNAEEAKIKVLRPGGNRCAVIVTTRNQSLPVSLGVPETATVRLRSLPEKDALDLLRKILGETKIDSALAAAKQIAKVVGRLPLALQVLGGTLRGKRRSLASYADSLEKQKEKLKLLQRLRLGEDPDFNVEACLNLSLELLESEEIDFFACLGVCAEDGFAQKTAMAAAGCEDEFDAEDFLDKLHDRSLLNYAENQHDRFVLHPLVREYARFLAEDRNLLNVAQERHAQFFMEQLQSDDLEDEAVVAEVATDLSDIFLAAKWLQNERGETTESRKEAYEFVLKLEPLFEQYGYWEEGITLMERLETWAEQSQDWYAIARCKMHQARYLSFLGELERAEEILICARDISSDEQKIEGLETRKERHAKVLNVLGGVYQKQGKTEKAIETFREVIAQETEIGNKRSLAIVYNRLGNLLQSQNNLEEAQQAFEEGIAIAESIDDKLTAAIGWNCLGGLLEKQGKLEAAQNAFEQGIAIAESIDEKHQLAIGWNCLGGLLEKQGKLEAAQNAFEQGIAIAESMDEKHQLAIGWNCLGGLLEKQEKLEAAQYAFEQRIAIAESIDDKHGLAIGWNCLGGLLEKQGKLEAAQNAFEQEIAIAESIDDKHGLAIGWNCLGGLLEKQGKLEAAQNAFEQTIKNTNFHHKRSLSISWSRLGKVLDKQGKLRDAEQAFQEVMAIAQSIDNKLTVAFGLYEFGKIYKSKRELKTAEKFLKESREIFEDKNDLPSLTKVMNTLGNVLEKQQKWKEAKKVLEESYGFDEKLGNKLGKAITANRLGQVIAHLEGDEAFERSLMYFNQSIRLGKELNNERHLAKVYTARGKVFLKREFYARALEELSQGFEIDAKSGNIRGLKIITSEITYVLYRLWRQEEALEYCERALEIAPEHNSFQELYDRIQRAIATGSQPTFLTTGWVRSIRYYKKQKSYKGIISPDDGSLDIILNNKNINRELISQLSEGDFVEVEVKEIYGKRYAKQINIIDEEDEDW